MAWIEVAPSGVYQIVCRVSGKWLKRSLKTSNRKKAELARGRLEKNLRLVEHGRLVLPPEADVPAFLLSDGKVHQPIAIGPPITVKELFT